MKQAVFFYFGVIRPEPTPSGMSCKFRISSSSLLCIYSVGAASEKRGNYKILIGNWSPTQEKQSVFQ